MRYPAISRCPSIYIGAENGALSRNFTFYFAFSQIGAEKNADLRRFFNRLGIHREMAMCQDGDGETEGLREVGAQALAGR